VKVRAGAGRRIDAGLNNKSAEDRMKRNLFAAALCALALSACDVLRGGLGMPTHERPVVTISNGVISVDPNPLRFARGHGNVNIIWKVETAGHRFAARGIVIDGEVSDGSRDVRPGVPLKPQDEIVDCRPLGNDQFQCLNKNRRPGIFKYTIRVIGPDGRELPPLDPAIINME
jgi:hypothetical protein